MYISIQDCQWSPWSESDCSKECGGGYKNFTRHVIKRAIRHGECPGATWRVEHCNEELCVDTGESHDFYIISGTLFINRFLNILRLPVEPVGWVKLQQNMRWRIQEHYPSRHQESHQARRVSRRLLEGWALQWDVVWRSNTRSRRIGTKHVPHWRHRDSFCPRHSRCRLQSPESKVNHWKSYRFHAEVGYHDHGWELRF